MGVGLAGEGRLTSEPAKPAGEAAQETRRPKKRLRHRLVDSQLLEQEARQVFGLELFGSDLWLYQLGYGAGLFHLLNPLYRRIKALARKHRHNPAVFEREFNRLFHRHLWKSSNEPWLQWALGLLTTCRKRLEKVLRRPNSEASPFTFPEDISQRQLAAFADLLPLFRSLFKGRRAPRVNPKKILANLVSLTAKRPGSSPVVLTRRIRKLDQQARAEGRHLTDGAIAAKVFPSYQDSDGHQKREFRERVRLARRR